MVSSGGSLAQPFGIALETDGDILVADLHAFDGSGGVIRVDQATAAQTEVSSGDSFVDPAGIAVVPEDIVFASSRSGNGDIYKMTPGSPAAPEQLTTDSAIDAEPAWSPNRQQVAFTSTRHGNVELYVMDDEGGNVTRLTNHSAVDTSPAWSPDGSQIAFASTRTNNRFDIYTIAADGSGPVQRLTRNAAADTFPDWSPTGTKIAFSTARTGNGDLYTINSTGSESGLTRLTTNSAVDTEPVWHGNQIAFSSNRNDSLNLDIYRRNDTPGGAETQLTKHPRPDITPAWSPDGSQLAFASNRDGGSNTEIYTIDNNPLNPNPQRQTNHPRLDLFPDW